MNNQALPVNQENTSVTPVSHQREIENHKTAAAHLKAAAIYHLEAARNYEAGDQEKADLCAFTALGHLRLATELSPV
jgi:hypothetical protein